MNCIGENSPDNEITNVSVMFLLSVKPLIGTEEEFFEAIVILPTETYEEGAWSALSTNLGGILCWVIARLISVRKVSLHSSNTLRGTVGRVVVPARRVKLQRLYIDFTQVGLGSNPLNPLMLLLFTSASAVALTTHEFTTPPLLRILLRREISLLSSSRRLGGRPRV